MQFVRSIVSRFVAGPIAAAAGWLASQGIISADQATDAETAVVMAVAVVVYGVGHKLLDRYINPGDGT